ncbi:MAG TPA: hypothetical protein VJA27_02370 [Patescibacteria group bacterium]|nr:hypothetical protein [Patescibacteria group bacterium]
MHYNGGEEQTEQPVKVLAGRIPRQLLIYFGIGCAVLTFIAFFILMPYLPI